MVAPGCGELSGSSKTAHAIDTCRLRTALVLLIFVMLLQGCAQVNERVYRDMETHLRADRPEVALDALEQLGNSPLNRALYTLNRAMLLHHNGQFEKSVEAFEQAKRYIGVFDATSVSESIAAYTLSEQMSVYQAAVYEKLFVHVYQIMNYLALGALDSARVEAMQIDLALTRLAESGHYLAAASARYVAGLIFEAQREYDSALVAYRQARDNYAAAASPAPADLLERLTRLSDELGLDSAANTSIANAPHRPADSDHNTGQLVVFHHVDLAPRKRQLDQTVMDPGSGRFYRVSLPVFQRRGLPPLQFSSRVGAQELSSE